MILAEQSARLRIRSATSRYATSLWLGLGSWRDRDIERFLSRVVPTIIGARSQVAKLTSAYVAEVSEAPRVPVVDVTDIRGVPDIEVYRRPAVQMRVQLSKGAAFQVAQAVAVQRLTSLVLTDLQLAMTSQARSSMRNTRYKQYVRTLTGAENCALCVVASTRSYYKGDLLPIHPGCDCGVAPYWSEYEAFQVVDPELLEAVHDAVYDKFGVSDRGARDFGGLGQYRDLVVTHRHGEIGPVIAWRGDRFTGPGDF